MYPYLFSPIKINGVEIKNRIAYPSLGLLYSYDMKLNDRYYHYFRARAAGGAGLITVGPVGVDFLGSGLLALSLANDEAIPSFTRLSRIIQDEGAKAWVQLFHAGGYSHPILINGETPIAPSPIFSSYSRVTPREMTHEDIQTVQQCFVDAAIRARDAGFDGVEIIASAGYLITQFLSPLKNQRTDEYGGSFENRVRFPRELIEKMRQALGTGYPITIRMAGNDFVPGSNTDRETPEIAKIYEHAGVDAINITGGWHESRVPQLPMELPRSAYAYLALNIKQAVSIPVMASNRISEFEMLPKAGADVGKSTKWILTDRLKRHGVKIKTSSKVTEIKKGLVSYETEGKTLQQQFDSIIIASGSRPVTTLSEAARSWGIPFVTVGDCIKPGKLNDAIHGGFWLRLKLTEDVFSRQPIVIEGGL